MTRTIWKFRINGGDISSREGDSCIQLPALSRILSGGLDAKGVLCVWVLVDPDSHPYREKTIYVRGTGHDCSDIDDKLYVDTVIDREYVWHVFADA